MSEWTIGGIFAYLFIGFVSCIIFGSSKSGQPEATNVARAFYWPVLLFGHIFTFMAFVSVCLYYDLKEIRKKITQQFKSRSGATKKSNSKLTLISTDPDKS